MDLLQKIERAFRAQRIVIKMGMTQLKLHHMPGSMTNRFMVVESVDGKKYLIRINGKLWPPFTRKQEENNVFKLERYGIKTHIVVNDVDNGFQICHFILEKKRFIETNHPEKKFNKLAHIARLMRRLHHVPDVENTYPVGPTIWHSFCGTSAEMQEFLSTELNMVLCMFSCIYQEQEHFVPSHNDLLPSSVYCRQGRASFVDWEYSGMNHRCYDLALFSEKASLSPAEEARLIHHYDPFNQFDMHNKMILMKPIVCFLLLLWRFPPKSVEQNVRSHASFLSLLDHIRKAFAHHSGQRLSVEIRLSFFERQRALADSSRSKKEHQYAEKAIA